MSEICRAPDLSKLEIPIDSWTKPFWDGCSDRRLLLPRCGFCRHFRWPPGPFCPHCQSQATEWVTAGIARIYSFTILRESDAACVPALIEFPQSDGIRLVAAIVDTPLDTIRIGAEATLSWAQAINARVPVFKI